MKIKTKVAGERVKLHVLPEWNQQTFEKFLAFTRSDDIFGLDVETTAIDDDEDSAGIWDPEQRMRMIQFGSKTEAWCFDLEHSDWRRAVDGFLHNEHKRFVSHTNYDVLWVWRTFGFNLGERAIDTLVMAALLYPGVTRKKDLKSLSSGHIDTGLQKAADALTERFKQLAPTGHRVGKRLKSWGFTNIPLDDEVFSLYAGLDAVYVRRLLDILATEIKRVGMSALSRREQRVARIATTVTWRGHRIDPEHVERIHREVEDEYLAAEKLIEERLGFRPLSPKLADWLIEYGMRPVGFTKTGRPELSKDTLPILAENHPPQSGDLGIGEIIQARLVISEHQNMLNNIRAIMRTVDDHGFTHCRINTQQAHTGRMSATTPAMQTFKKDDKRLRGCYIAREGYVFVTADWSSQEIRIAAQMSGDKALLRIVNEGLNQHVLTATSIFDTFVDKDKSPFEYKAAKILDFELQYGAGPKKIGLQLGVSYKRARKMWEGWRDTYSGLVAWSERMAERAVVVNPWGRRIPRDRFRAYANGNYMIQSSGRDMLGDAIVALDDQGWGEYLWMFLHDEIVMEVPVELAAAAEQAMVECMTCEFGEVLIPVETEVLGKRWSGGE